MQQYHFLLASSWFAPAPSATFLAAVGDIAPDFLAPDDFAAQTFHSAGGCS
jgi:hypothetical protein